MNSMWPPIAAIAKVQFLAMRNRLPRTNFGTVLMWLLTALWYGMFVALAAALAVVLPRVAKPALETGLPIGLLAVLAYTQIAPLVTMSSGWSVQLSKIQIYPIKTDALFTIELILRLTASPEMIVILLGGMLGLLANPSVPAGAPLVLLFFIPLNLFLSLAIRELLLRSLQRRGFRELRGILILAIAVLPQLFLRTSLGSLAKPYLIRAAAWPASPWNELARLSLGSFSALSVGFTIAWLLLSYLAARWQFGQSLLTEEGAGSTGSAKPERQRRFALLSGLANLVNRVTSDPMAALIEREFRSLLRMPRFRVLFGMACIFSIIVFIPMILRGSTVGFIHNNFLPVVTMYGLLILGDVLLFNVFGFDRKAVQLYFVAPVPFDAVLKAKNIVAMAFVAAQIVTVMIMAAIFRIQLSWLSIADAFAVTAVVAVFLLSLGNLTSVTMPRPVNPNETFRKNTGGKMQLWLFVSFAGLSVPVGLAFLARWATQLEWPFFGVLLIDLIIGLIVYRLATESALHRAMLGRERIVDELSKGSDPIGI